MISFLRSVPAPLDACAGRALRHRIFLGATLFTACTFSASAHAFSLETVISEGCHERITMDSWREVKRDVREAPLALEALRDDLPFHYDEDLGDENSIALLIGVRDVDLSGHDPLDLFDIARTHGNPNSQHEHCLRGADDDEPDGTNKTLTKCRQFIRDTALNAATKTGRIDFPVSLETRGKVDVSLPERAVMLGVAVHTLQDSFAHSYRSLDGKSVRTSLNWVDFVTGGWDETRDGPEHLSKLDECDRSDPATDLRVTTAIAASRALLAAGFAEGITETERATRIDALLDQYLGIETGCTAQNNWCDAPERALRAEEGNCAFTMTPIASTTSAGAMLTAVLAIALVLRKRRVAIPAVLGALLLTTSLAHADEENTTAEGSARADTDAGVVANVVEHAETREDHRAGVRFGAVATLGGSIDRPALAGSLGLRLRLSDRWTVGVDGEWNPWIAVQTSKVRSGVANIYATGIFSYPIDVRHFALRTTAHLGTSTLLYDLYGADSGSTGLYGGIKLLGVALDLGQHWKLIVDPAEVVVVAPHLKGAPLVHRQYRFSIGIQWGG